MKTDVSVCLIEGNDFIREGLKSFLSQTRYKINADFVDVQDLLDYKKIHTECTCELVIVGMSIDHDPKDVEHTLKTIQSNFLESRMVIISPTLDENLILDFSKHADGYILSDISVEALIGSLDLIMLGEKIFPTSMVDLISKTQHSWEILAEEKSANDSALSKREFDILECLVNGEPNKVIASNLSITDATVKVHLKSILRKLGVTNRTQAAIWAVNSRLVESNAARQSV